MQESGKTLEHQASFTLHGDMILRPNILNVQVPA